MRGFRGRTTCLTAAALALGLGPCAFAQQTFTGGVADGVGNAVKQPFRDLSLIRDKTPEPLNAAAKAVYNKGDGDLDCGEIAAEVATLDKLLGPDLDVAPGAKPSTTTTAIGIAGDLLRGASDIPFRGVVRRVSGAYQRDVERNRAVVAGMVRRGYLKGLAESQNCSAASPLVSEERVSALTIEEPAPAKATEPPPLIDAPVRPALPILAIQAPQPRALAAREND